MAIPLSEHFNVLKQALEAKGVFDAVIGVDTKLFIDPLLLNTTDIPEFHNSRTALTNYFSTVITLIQFGDNQRTKQKAIKLLTFPEPTGVSIGYGNDNDDGAGIGPEKAERIFNSALEIYQLGLQDPEIIEIIGIFEDGFGPDLISDMTINILEDKFCAYTERVCTELNIEHTISHGNFTLPAHPNAKDYLLFIPSKLLRDLPVAASWEEVFEVAKHNSELRDKVNSLLKNAFGKNVKPTKKDFKKLLWGSQQDLRQIIDIYKNYNPEAYNFTDDPFGLGGWYSVGLEVYRNGSFTIIKKPENETETIQAGTELVARFKKAVEDNGANKILHGLRDGKLKPYREEVAQLIFFALADSYCKDRNILLSRESDSGSGPVDFSIGTSYDAKILFELKKSSNDIVSGYTNQLEIYKKSENALHAFYVVLRMTKESRKIDQILALQDEAIKNGESPSEIVIIDARLKESASKRK